MKAWLNLRYALAERVAIFRQGLERLGYEVCQGLTFTPAHDDLLVTWNRIGDGHRAACEFDGLPVIVAENATWGNSFAGDRWYSLSRNYHNTAGNIPTGGPERWDGLGVDLAKFRTGGDTLILPQRGIGPPPVAMPRDWPQRALARHGGRVRSHPGTQPCKPLADDLEGIGQVVTWGSGAAVKALMLGVPVVSEMPNWIGEQDNTDEGRLAMFRRLAWGQWRLSEIASGEAFEAVLA